MMAGVTWGRVPRRRHPISSALRRRCWPASVGGREEGDWMRQLKRRVMELTKHGALWRQTKGAGAGAVRRCASAEEERRRGCLRSVALCISVLG